MIKCRSIWLNRKSLLAIIVTAIVALLGRNGNSIIGIATLLLYACFFTNPEYLLGPLLFLTVFDDLLVVFGGTYSRYVTVILILALLFKGTIKRNKIVAKQKGLSTYLIFLFFMSIILSFFSINGYRSFPMTFVLNLCLCFAMINYYPRVNTDQLMYQLYMYSVMASCYTMFLFCTSGISLVQMGGRMTVGEGVNSNQTAQGLALITVILIIYFILSKEKKNIFGLVIVIISVVALFLTGSRSAFIAAITTVFICIFLLKPANERNTRFTALLIVLLILGILIYMFLINNYPALAKRFSINTIIESGGSSRITIWKTYLKKIFPDYWVLGLGFDPKNTQVALTKNGLSFSGVHNIILEIFSVSGVIGFIAFFSFFRAYFKNAVKVFKSRGGQIIIPIAMTICLLLDGMGENTLTIRLLWFSVGISILFENAYNNDLLIEL